MTKTRTIKIHQLWKDIYKPSVKKWVKSGEHVQPGAIVNLKDFSDYFDGRRITKKAARELVYSAKFQTGAKTAQREYKRFHENLIADDHITLKEFKKMSTREFADIMKKEIRDRYQQDKDNGMSASEAKKDISNYFFGS